MEKEQIHFELTTKNDCNKKDVSLNHTSNQQNYKNNDVESDFEIFAILSNKHEKLDIIFKNNGNENVCKENCFIKRSSIDFEFNF